MWLWLTKRNYWLPQDNDGDLPFQCFLKAWMSKYSLPRYSHTPLYRIHSVGDLLPGTTLSLLDLDLDLDLFLLGSQRIYRSIMGKFFSKPTLELTPGIYRNSLDLDGIY